MDGRALFSPILPKPLEFSCSQWGQTIPALGIQPWTPQISQFWCTKSSFFPLKNPGKGWECTNNKALEQGKTFPGLETGQNSRFGMKIAAWVAAEAPRVTPAPGWAGIPWKPSSATHSQADLGSQGLKIEDSRPHSQPGMRELHWEVGKAPGGSGDGGRIPR